MGWACYCVGGGVGVGVGMGVGVGEGGGGGVGVGVGVPKVLVPRGVRHDAVTHGKADGACDLDLNPRSDGTSHWFFLEIIWILAGDSTCSQICCTVSSPL